MKNRCALMEEIETKEQIQPRERDLRDTLVIDYSIDNKKKEKKEKKGKKGKIVRRRTSDDDSKKKGKRRNSIPSCI